MLWLSYQHVLHICICFCTACVAFRLPLGRRLACYYCRPCIYGHGDGRWLALAGTWSIHMSIRIRIYTIKNMCFSRHHRATFQACTRMVWNHTSKMRVWVTIRCCWSWKHARRNTRPAFAQAQIFGSSNQRSSQPPTRTLRALHARVHVC